VPHSLATVWGVLGAQAQRNAAAAQRISGGVADGGEFGALRNLLNGGREESPAPAVCLAFCEVAGAGARVADAVLGAGKVTGNDEVALAGRVPSMAKGGTPLGEVFLEDARYHGASVGAVLGLTPVAELSAGENLENPGELADERGPSQTPDLLGAQAEPVQQAHDHRVATYEDLSPAVCAPQ
jgi:hypothetical protein